MITNNEFVSRVVNNLKGLSKDAHISKRFILSTGRTKSKFLMSQKLDELTMFREEDCITTIPCFELERIDYKSCDIFEFRLCDKLMRSKHKLPEGFFGKNGAGKSTLLRSIAGISTIAKGCGDCHHRTIAMAVQRTVGLRVKYLRGRHTLFAKHSGNSHGLSSSWCSVLLAKTLAQLGQQGVVGDIR